MLLPTFSPDEKKDKTMASCSQAKKRKEKEKIYHSTGDLILMI